MSITESNAYQRVMQKRAKRLGTSVEEAQREPVSTSGYLAATEAAAARLGVDPSSIFEDDSQRLENSSCPTAECITPEDVEDLVEALGAEKLSIDQMNTPEGQQVVASVWPKAMSHLAICDPCRTLLNACQPSPQRRAAFQNHVLKKFSLVGAARG